MDTTLNQPQPVRAFKSGVVRAVIWEHTHKEGVAYSVALGRVYQDAQMHWHTSDSFELQHLAALVTVVGNTEAWLRDHAKSS